MNSKNRILLALISELKKVKKGYNLCLNLLKELIL